MTEHAVSIVECDYIDASAVAYLTYGVDVVGRRARVLVRTRSGHWVTRWVSLQRLRAFRVKAVAGSDLMAAPHWPIARDHWTQEAVDNLNRLNSCNGVHRESCEAD